MKELSSTRHARNSLIYPKKRPSPHGVSKPHSQSHRKSPRSAKSALVQQRHKDAAALAIRRDAILLEEEYRDEIRYYMLDMEVRLFFAYTLPPIHYL